MKSPSNIGGSMKLGVGWMRGTSASGIGMSDSDDELRTDGKGAGKLSDEGIKQKIVSVKTPS